MARKPGMGRQKLPMAKIHDRSRRDVTFSKRRAGLFKKAHELSILCGAEVGLIVFSPAGKVFSYGNPDVETITNKLMNGGGGGGGWDRGGGGGGGDRGGGVAAHLNAHLAQLQEQLAAEKKRGEELDKMHRAFEAEHGRCWWRDENPPESITLLELERLKEALEDLKRHAAEQAQKLVMEQAAAAAPNSPFLYGNYAAGPSPANPNVGGPLPPYGNNYNPYASGPSWANPNVSPLPPYGNNYNPYAAGPSSANPNVGSPLLPYGSNYNPYAAGPSSAFPSTGGPNPNYAARPSSANPYLYGGSGGSGYGPQGPF